MEPSARLQPVRLLLAYRGHRAGDVITTTPGMAGQFVARGIAEYAEPGDLPARPAVERAVACPTVETRG